jgi:hypothetical protein
MQGVEEFFQQFNIMLQGGQASQNIVMRDIPVCSPWAMSSCQMALSGVTGDVCCVSAIVISRDYQALNTKIPYRQR